MFEDRCARCFVRADKVRLFDVIYEGKSGVLCERCSIIENIPIIKKPKEEQIKESDMTPTVYDRMKRMSGIPDVEKSTSESMRMERLHELDNNPELMNPVKEKPDMLEHFNWTILRERRRLGLTQERLAEVVNIPAQYIELLEKGNIPNNVKIIEKLENFFKTGLMKKSPFTKESVFHPVLLDEDGNILDHIPEPDVEIMFSEDKYTNELIKKESDEDFDIHKADLKKVNLNDLMELHRKKVSVSKEEQKIEQKKIEDQKNNVPPHTKMDDLNDPCFLDDPKLKLVSYDPIIKNEGLIYGHKEKIIEARKEELRFLREKQSRELDNILGGSELLGEEDKDKNKVDRLFDEAFGE